MHHHPNGPACAGRSASTPFSILILRSPPRMTCNNDAILDYYLFPPTSWRSSTFAWRKKTTLPWTPTGLTPLTCSPASPPARASRRQHERQRRHPTNPHGPKSSSSTHDHATSDCSIRSSRTSTTSALKRPITITPRPGWQIRPRLRPRTARSLPGARRSHHPINHRHRDKGRSVPHEPRREHRPSTTHDLPNSSRKSSTLKTRGYTAEQISAKIDLDRAYVCSITHLLDRGEERLIRRGGTRNSALVHRRSELVPPRDPRRPTSLREAYESGGLRGQKLISVKRLLAQRAKDGKTLTPQRVGPNASTRKPSSAHTRARRQNSDRSAHVRTAPRNAFWSSRARCDQLLADDRFTTAPQGRESRHHSGSGWQ